MRQLRTDYNTPHKKNKKFFSKPLYKQKNIVYNNGVKKKGEGNNPSKVTKNEMDTERKTKQSYCFS